MDISESTRRGLNERFFRGEHHHAPRSGERHERCKEESRRPSSRRREVEKTGEETLVGDFHSCGGNASHPNDISVEYEDTKEIRSGGKYVKVIRYNEIRRGKIETLHDYMSTLDSALSAD